jgi:heme-degrading monooxygenase HmoA
MVTEIAQIDVKPGMEREFEEGVEKARPIFRQAKGFRRLGLLRSIEKPQRYRLMIEWETLENHTVDFYGSDNWKAWRALVGHCFAGPPEVDHSSTALPLV